VGSNSQPEEKEPWPGPVFVGARGLYPRGGDVERKGDRGYGMSLTDEAVPVVIQLSEAIIDVAVKVSSLVRIPLGPGAVV